jgi:hypothetical protein
MTLSTFKRLYQEYHDCGLNVKDFCANHGFAPSTFYYWKKQLEAPSQHAADGFIPLIIDSNQPSAVRRSLQTAPNKSSDVSEHHAPIEFVFPNGTKMVIRENVDMRLLKAFVHLFD